MRRFSFSLVLPAAITAGALAPFLLLMVAASCASSTAAERGGGELDASNRREGGPVEPAEAGAYDGSVDAGPPPECAKYCDLVMETCTAEQAQYASRNECLAFCSRLPPGKAGESEGNSVACRQFYAGSPARTDALGYCGAAGPFGGGICGDRCPIFCELTLAACAPDAGPAAPYASYPDCQTACAGFAYRDGGADGGGESPDGPTTGDTLNCRLFHVREAVRTGKGCADLGAASAACQDDLP